jgi:GGDEF domain-containing protein
MAPISWYMSGGKPVRAILVALMGWAVLREAEVGPLRSALHGPAFGKLAYWIVVVGASLLTLARARSVGGRERLAWGLIGLGSLLWACGDVYWTLVLSKREVIPVPSLSDAGYLAFYPLVFAGLCLLLSARIHGTPRTLWVDGITAALAAGALSAAIVLQTVLDTVGGDALGVATNLAYPFGDLILLSVVIASFALRGWRADRTWLLIGVGIVLFWIADSYYLVTIARETYTFPSVMDGGWTSCLILLAVAGWQRPPRAVTVDDQRGVRFTALPIAFATLGLAILVIAALNGLNAVAVLLAAASLLTVFGRLILTLRENAGMLASSRREALTDALTGLGNRRALSRDLEGAVAGHRDAVLLGLFDLDGFKHYNDSYGHPAGDALLERLGTKLAEHVDGVGSAYRMVGDEFCVLLARRARRCASPTRGCTPTRTAGGPRRAARAATSCCVRSPSAIRASDSTSAASPPWPRPWRVACTSTTSRSSTFATPPSCTTWARWRSPMRFSTSPRRSIPPSGSSSGATRSSASASSPQRPRCGRSPPSCAPATSAGTAPAIPTTCAARRSRSAPGSSRSAMRSTR